MAASLSDLCETELHHMYNVNSKTYNTMHDPNLMSEMTTKLDAPFSANFHVFNGDMEALQEFTNTCESYSPSSSQSAFQSSSAGGRVTFLSSTNKCTHDFNMGIPACIPSSCGDHSDAEVATALTDNPTPLFEGNDCSNVYWATEHIRNQNGLPLEEFSNSCMGDLITVAGSALAGASNVTAISGVKASGERCVAYYNGQEYGGVSIINGEFIPISYEMVCDGKVQNAMDGFFCMPSSCESRQMVAAALNEITHAEDVNPYFAFLFFSWNWRANCKWVYRVPEEALVSDNTDSSRVNETVANQSESSSSSSVGNQRGMSLLGLIGSIGVVFLTMFVYS